MRPLVERPIMPEPETDCCAVKTAKGPRLCPSCGVKGKTVKPKTIESLVSAETLTRLTSRAGFLFCATPSCDHAYFHPESGVTVSRTEVTVRIGLKELHAPRPICYCFGHSVEDIVEEIAATGSCAIPDSIKTKCGQGLHRCAETNPAGGCCLGSINKIVKDAQDRAIATEPAHPTDPAPQTQPAKSVDRMGTFASVGAVVSAALSSACCWLPLLLIGFGASAGSVSGFFDAYRTHLLVATGLLLSLSFYLVYFRKESCGEGTTCERPNTTLQRMNKVMTWAATTAVVLFALFPNYVGVLLGSGDVKNHAALSKSDKARRYSIEGMTCEGCSSTLSTAISSVNGLGEVSVSFPNREATVAAKVAWSRELDLRVIGAIKGAGYKGTRLGAGADSRPNSGEQVQEK